MFVWSDELGPRRRTAWLLLIHNGVISLFAGESIPGVVAIVGRDYTQNGVWSHNTWRLELAPGVRAIAGRDGFETRRFTEGLRAATGEPTDQWVEVANALGVTLSEAQRFVRSFRPDDAVALDRVEADLAAVAAGTGGDWDTVAINFGSPTNRAIAAGFWTWPVVVDVDGHVIAIVAPSRERGWNEPVVDGRDVRVLTCERASGMHGGCVSLLLAVPFGATAEHREMRADEGIVV